MFGVIDIRDVGQKSTPPPVNRMFCLLSSIYRRRKRLFLFAAHLFGEAPHGELITGGGRHDQISVNGSTWILTSGIWITPSLCVSIVRLCFICSVCFSLAACISSDVCCLFHLSVGRFGESSCGQPSLESCRMWKL